MSTTADLIRERLAVLEPERLEVGDDSHLHAGHAGARSGGGHFSLTIVSPRFVELGALTRHRLIYAQLGDLMQGAVHALQINAMTPEEAATRST
ncbi:BolA family protein [Viridibacterium curvum]|uniref:BolA family protein n=1 Tax=Viridibacterium curvum TaxID=1101404 RepID=UPI0031F15F70